MKDILKKQKIKKRAFPKKLFVFFGLIIVLSASAWLWWPAERGESEQTLWAVEVRTMDALPLSSSLQDFIVETAHQHLRAGTRQQLREAAQAIGGEAQLAAVQVIKTARARAVVFVDVRRPALVVQVNGKLRYVSRRGDVYGRVQKKQQRQASKSKTNKQASKSEAKKQKSKSKAKKITEAYPVLAGVLDTTREYVLDEDRIYVLSDSEQANVQQGLELMKMAMQNGFICEKIIYEQYRGWQAKIKDVTALVFFGHAPFTTKLQKLRDILASLSAKNTQAERIELDYEDKAFVQQKKI